MVFCAKVNFPLKELLADVYRNVPRAAIITQPFRLDDKLWGSPDILGVDEPCFGIQERRADPDMLRTWRFWEKYLAPSLSKESNFDGKDLEGLEWPFFSAVWTRRDDWRGYCWLETEFSKQFHLERDGVIDTIL